MSYSSSSGSAVTVLCFAVLAQLYFLAGTVAAGYTPGGQCVDDDNCCFGQVDVDYLEIVDRSPYKVIEILQTATSSQVDHVRVYLTKTSTTGSYSVDSQIFVKDSTAAIHNVYTQTDNGYGYIDEWGKDAKGNSILFPIRILCIDRYYCMMYYRCQEDKPEAQGDTLYIACPVDVELPDSERQALKDKAYECGFNVNWQRVE